MPKNLVTFYFISGIQMFLLSGCQQDYCYKNNYLSITNYPFHSTISTTSGILVDDTYGFLADEDLRRIDTLVEELEECSGISIKRECFSILIPPDWYVSECSGQQLFPCRIDPQLCIDKGLTQEDLDRCPCACRAIIQDDWIVVTTPNLRLFKAELARMVTGINNPWEAEIGACLRN